MTTQPEISLELKLATPADFNYTDHNGNTKPRIGFFFFIKEKDDYVRYVFDSRITRVPEEREKLKQKIRKEQVFIIKPTHPRNNLPGIATNR